MGQKELAKLAEELLKSSELRAVFRRDPKAAAKQAKVELDAEDYEALLQLGVQDMNDAELVARLTRRMSARD